MKTMLKCLFFIFFISMNAWSYNITNDFKQGFYWENYPISLSVEETDTDLKDTLEKLSEDAIGEWEARTGLSLWDMQSGTKNVIRWSRNFAAETNMDPVSVLAVAVRHTFGPYFAKSEIIINGDHPLNMDLTHLLTTITHELGHTMGLDHSDEMEAVMAPTLQDPYKGLHNDDIDGMNFSYNEGKKRQLTGYVSPLAYDKKEVKQPLSCGTVGVVGSSSSGGFISLAFGMLIGFVRKIFSWFKSLL
jgi:hypothetical protein